MEAGMRRMISLLFVAALITTACATSTDDTTSLAPRSTAGSTTTSQPTSTTQTPTTTEAPTTTTTATTTTTTVAPTTTTLAGNPIDIGPAAGDRVAVVGVAFDDVLNLRAGPGTNQTILAGLDPTYAQMVAQGEARALPNSIWYKVEADGTVGWVSSRFVAYLGTTNDLTSMVVDRVGEIPTAPTMLELADIVADVLKSEDPASVITVTVPPSEGDLGEVTIDIMGLGDDAVAGLRVVVFGQPTEDGDGFGLKSVEATSLCSRGVSEGLLCN